MPENQKDKKDGTLEEDQKERGYYYDDAHGYEEYDPEEDDSDPEVGPRDVGTETRGVRDAGTGENATRRLRDAGDAATRP